MQSFDAKFDVQQKLEGKFCDILKCTEKSTSKVYIAKRFKQPCRKIQSLLNCPEVVLMKKVPFHRNIFSLLDYFFDTFGDRVTFLYDVVDLNLRNMLKDTKGGFPEKLSKKYLHQLVLGLDHLHKHGFFHRNINPENILIKHYSGCATGNETFQIAGLENTRGIYSVQPYTECVTANRYKPPECILTAGYYGPKVDIWGLGCVFYELLKQKQLFRGHSDIDQMEKIHTVLGTPRSILSIRPRNSMEPLFKKRSGSGLDQLLADVSLKGKNVLKTMIEYEPDLRINTKRLLKNPYFSETLNERYKGRCCPENWAKEQRRVKTNI